MRGQQQLGPAPAATRYNITNSGAAGFRAGRLPEWFDIVQHVAFLADWPGQLGEGLD
jgi:hypothetical protein